MHWTLCSYIQTLYWRTGNAFTEPRADMDLREIRKIIDVNWTKYILIFQEECNNDRLGSWPCQQFQTIVVVIHYMFRDSNPIFRCCT